ncbi:Uncharacterised protein [Mycobacteroides abscessus subsp. abscessus]|nr:Uncharacterised protein [Mycobacteroides abscessus subsp. abscessus]
MSTTIHSGAQGRCASAIATPLIPNNISGT